MATEPAITFLDLACAIGADAAHARTIEGILRQLYCDALQSEFPPGSLGWNLHSAQRRLNPDYLLEAVQPDGRLDLSPDFGPIAPKHIVETLAGDKWPAADRALDLMQAGAEGDAYRLVAEAPLPDEGSNARLFVESLAVTLSAAWHFCERHGRSVPSVLRQMLVAWVEGGGRTATKFAPRNCVAIPDAVTEILDALHPGERQHAAAELRGNQGGALPASYLQYCEHEPQAGKLLLRALADGELVAVLRVNGDDWAVPADYWETDGARVVTLLRGTLHARDSSSADWEQHHGRPCFMEEASFRRWLRGKCWPAVPTETPSAIGAKAFDRTYWDYMMVLAWVYFGEHALVERVADSAVNGRTFWQQEKLPDGRVEMVETDAGPMTALSLTFLANQRRENPETAATAPKMTCSEAETTILDRLKAGALTAYGLKNNAGDLQEIPALWWADARVYFDRDRPFAGPDTFRSGATRWYGMLFKREHVLSIWPDPLATNLKQPSEAVAKPMEPDIARTGGAGRPTIMHIIKSELVARAERGELKLTLAAESEFLRDWAAEKHPNAPTPTAKAIQNSLREVYRRHAQRQHLK